MVGTRPNNKEGLFKFYRWVIKEVGIQARRKMVTCINPMVGTRRNNKEGLFKSHRWLIKEVGIQARGMGLIAFMLNFYTCMDVQLSFHDPALDMRLKVTNEVSFNHSVSNKGERNNCFVKCFVHYKSSACCERFTLT